MADTNTKIESKLYICETPQNDDLANAAAFEALTWVEIGKVVTLPDFGVTENLVVQNYVGGGLSQTSKGFKQGQQSSVVVGNDPDDAGQVALHTASLSKSKFAFKLESADSPNPATTTNTVRYTRMKVNLPTFTGGEGEAFDNYEFPVAVNQVPIKVDPEAI